MRTPFDPAAILRIVAEPEAATRLFAFLHEGLKRDAGCGLLTASVYDLEAMRSRRVFSENEATYPVGNFKRLDRNRYFETVLAERRAFSSTTIEEIAEVFFDWEKIRDLGFESNLNIPAVAEGTVIGTVNLLERKGHYTDERVAKALAWQPVVTLAFLLLLRGGREDATFHADPRPPTGPGLEGG